MKPTLGEHITTRIAVNNWVSKPAASDIRALLTRSYPSTQALFTELLTAASREESHLPSAQKRNALKETIACVWEVARYGWHQTAFGRPINIPSLRLTLGCRRTKALCRIAAHTGSAIAKRQMEGTL